PLLARRSPAAVAARADRGGPRTRGRTDSAAADQPLSGGTLVRARRARCRHRTGTGLAAPGGHAARAGRPPPARSARDARRRAAPLPTRGLRLARRALGA